MVCRLLYVRLETKEKNRSWSLRGRGAGIYSKNCGSLPTRDGMQSLDDVGFSGGYGLQLVGKELD